MFDSGPYLDYIFSLGDMAVLACGFWEGGAKYIHENEAIFDKKPQPTTSADATTARQKRDKMIESEYLKDNQAMIQKLRQMPTLELFDEKSLAGALQLSKIRKYEPGELILEEDSFDNWIYFLISGKVKIEKTGKELNVLESVGDIFGEMGVIDGSARSASAHAVDETVCLAVDASYIDRLAGNDKAAFGFILYQVFAESLANRLRVTSDKLIRAEEEISKLKNAE